MRISILALLILFPSLSFASGIEVTQIYPKSCVQGEYRQPSGPFSLYVFCDDALGSNVAVCARDMHNPVLGPSNQYNLGNRFWQGEEWAYDVASFAWLSEKELLLSTSAIYGTGSVYILSLLDKTSKKIFEGSGAVVIIKEVTSDSIHIEMEGPKGTFIRKELPL